MARRYRPPVNPIYSYRAAVAITVQGETYPEGSIIPWGALSDRALANLVARRRVRVEPIQTPAELAAGAETRETHGPNDAPNPNEVAPEQDAPPRYSIHPPGPRAKNWAVKAADEIVYRGSEQECHEWVAVAMQDASENEVQPADGPKPTDGADHADG